MSLLLPEQCSRYQGGAQVDQRWLEFALRAQRDYSWEVPINRVLTPTADLTAMWFRQLPWSAATRIPQRLRPLLESGYRRLQVDIHWTGEYWAMCNELQLNVTFSEWHCQDPGLKTLLGGIGDWLGRTASIWFKDTLTLVLNPTPLPNSTDINEVSGIPLYNIFNNDPVLSGLILTPEALARADYNRTNWPSRKWIVDDQRKRLLLALPDNPPVTNQTLLLTMAFNTSTITNTYWGAVDPSTCSLSPDAHSWLLKPLPSIGAGDIVSTCHNTHQWSVCGISPVVSYDNQTLPVILGTVWSWNYRQPANVTAQACVSLVASTGRWAETECTAVTKALCRNDLTDVFSLGSFKSDYRGDTWVCPANSTYDIPVTPSENRQVWDIINSQGIDRLLINLNDRSVGGCFVKMGETCPYYDQEAAYSFIVRLSAVGGLILLLIFGTFFWIDLRKNQRARQFRKRKEEAAALLDRLDYATVPH